MSDSQQLVICLTTVATNDDAEKIAATLLDQALAACVQIEGPIRSHYVWEGQRHRDEEYRLVIKSTADAWPSLKDTLHDMHPYDEPQILRLDVSDSTPGYCQWVIAQTSRK